MKDSKGTKGASFSRTTIMAVLSFVFSIGGYGGYVVSEQQGQYMSNFEDRLHIVERVVDGDTIALEDGSTVRLQLINAPELDECFGLESKKILQTLLLGRKVRLQKDSTATDAEGRLLRYVFLYSDHPREDNVFVNDYLVKQGFAHYTPYPKDKLFHFVLINSEGIARNKLRGLHKACVAESEVVEQPSKKCNIKGNNSTAGYGKTYFYPGCSNYENLKVEKKTGDQWFCNEEEAQKAGYIKSGRCPNH
jgi:endonuclease YncB( thermonuclease family)